MTVKKRSNERMPIMGWMVIGLCVGISAFFGYRMVSDARQEIKESQTNSPEWKTRFLAEFPGLETAASLRDDQKSRVIAQANKRFCPCKCGYTFATCLKDDQGCPMRSKNLAVVRSMIEREAVSASNQTPATR